MQWSPRPGETVALAAVGLALAVAAVFSDPAGRLLLGAAALLLGVVAVRDAVARPRLIVGPEGVTVRGLLRATTIAWPALRVRLREQRRWGVRGRTLELEDARDDAVLVVLGRRDLGADPAAVAEALLAPDAPG
ncbi:PH domain-containing protein [Modestobacter roseus]|uniref:PH (Pleckstrin Homology) domain-containing protein n=1 Tax=Modestobacter roseus TaxID=1181884 RepID=A0A562IWK9_9ACTN|nr:PH domain-containing protein [Modestobacter roseus]MQA33428.1 PH domain-containing protein [Modestobacter roseus]TWH74985.1 PH (Pleckstrin Homology) domain-containing protein [Modestobacter roseus]